jgi:SpoVK/Ycf46/Vps4 family AAA+-type ATPase
MMTQVPDSYPKTSRELLELLEARYPALFVQTYEEFRVREVLEYFVANKKHLSFYWWSVTKGLRDVDDNIINNKLGQPQKILAHIMESKEQAIYLLQDMHPYVELALIRRMIRDLVDDLCRANEHRFVVMTGPTLKMPSDLAKELVLLDFGLPTKTQLAEETQLVRNEIENPKKNIVLSTSNTEVADRAAGMTLRELSGALSLSLVRTNGKDFDLDTILSEKKRIIAQDSGLEYHEVADLPDVGGMDLLKVWLDQRRAPLFEQKARDFGLDPPKGVILVGYPGTGKSLVAKTVGRSYKIPLMRWDVGKSYGRYVGETENNTRKVIQLAEVAAPCVLWIDEMEKGMSGVRSSGSTDSGVTARMFGTFLTWMQEKKAPVFVVATVNDVQSLPPETLRKGRFDEIFFVDYPTTEERAEIFAIHIKRRKRDPDDFDLDRLAGMTEGFSGAEIEQAVADGLFKAYQEEHDLCDDDIASAINTTVPLSQSMEEEIKSLKEWAGSRTRPASSLTRRVKPKKKSKMASRQAVRRPLGVGTDA